MELHYINFQLVNNIKEARLLINKQQPKEDKLNWKLKRTFKIKLIYTLNKEGHHLLEKVFCK